MGKKATSPHSGQSLRVLLFFCGAVILLIFLSLLVKIAAIVAKSSFDGRHRYTIAITGKPLHILSFAPDANMISSLEFASSKTYTNEELSILLHIPIDGYVSEKDRNESFTMQDPKKEIDDYFQHLFFSYPHLLTNATIVDIFRLWMFEKSVEPQNVFQESLDKPLEQTESGTIDKIAAKLFVDATVSEENKSIQVINGTGVAGIGNDFAQLVTNIGGNVVAVTSAHTDAAKTSIRYTGQSSYTLSRLEKIVKVKAEHIQKGEIFDIIVAIGKDRVALFQN